MESSVESTSSLNRPDPNDTADVSSQWSKIENNEDLKEKIVANFQKNNIPNVNVPERIIICLDVCYNGQDSLYRLADGTTFTSLNMMKRAIDFFVYLKSSINKRTEYALIILKDEQACWMIDFTNNIKEFINAVNYIQTDDCISEQFDFSKVMQVLKQKLDIPQYEQDSLTPPPYVVRMLVLYGRSNSELIIPKDDPYYDYLKQHVYFYIDILLTHEEECAKYKCEEIYDALQLLDDGYSYVFEVSRNAAKLHDSIAKLVAHPLQRTLQKHTDYKFGTKY